MCVCVCAPLQQHAARHDQIVSFTHSLSLSLLSLSLSLSLADIDIEREKRERGRERETECVCVYIRVCDVAHATRCENAFFGFSLTLSKNSCGLLYMCIALRVCACAFAYFFVCLYISLSTLNCKHLFLCLSIHIQPSAHRVAQNLEVISKTFSTNQNYYF